MMEPDLPLELLIRGYPVSHQTKRRAALDRWKRDVQAQARMQLEEGVFALLQTLIVTVFFFPRTTLESDLDNAAKPILDALGRCVFRDDRQIERLVLQRFEDGKALPLEEDGTRLDAAVASVEPIIYIRIEAFDEDIGREGYAAG